MKSITTLTALQAALAEANGTPLADRLSAYAPQFADPALKGQTELLDLCRAHASA